MWLQLCSALHGGRAGAHSLNNARLWAGVARGLCTVGS